MVPPFSVDPRGYHGLIKIPARRGLGYAHCPFSLGHISDRGILSEGERIVHRMSKGKISKT
jgi:hypothetical protein